MEKNNNYYYLVKYQRILIEEVLNTQFKSIKDLSDFINKQEIAKMKKRGKDYTVYNEKIISKVFENLFQYLKLFYKNTFNYNTPDELCLFFINEFKQCLKDFTTSFKNSENYLFKDEEIKFKIIKIAQ